MAGMRPGAPQFSMGDFIWQEIKNLLEDPQKICSYNSYIMFMTRRITGTRFPNDVSHKTLRPPMSKIPRFPSPLAPEVEENEIEVEEQHQQQQAAA